MDFLGVDLTPSGIVSLLASFWLAGVVVGGLVVALSAVYRRG